MHIKLQVGHVCIAPPPHHVSSFRDTIIRSGLKRRKMSRSKFVHNGKVHARTGHEGPERGKRYSSTLSLT